MSEQSQPSQAGAGKYQDAHSKLWTKLTRLGIITSILRGRREKKKPLRISTFHSEGRNCQENFYKKKTCFSSIISQNVASEKMFTFSKSQSVSQKDTTKPLKWNRKIYHRQNSYGKEWILQQTPKNMIQRESTDFKPSPETFRHLQLQNWGWNIIFTP